MTQNGWIFVGIYGQYRTAASVARKLRSEGWETKIEQDAYLNASVFKRKKP